MHAYTWPRTSANRHNRMIKMTKRNFILKMKCRGGKIKGERKECRICNNLVGRTRYARHVRSCKQRNNLPEERAAQVRSDQTNAPTARKYVSERTVCTYSGADVTATNLAKHQKSRACMASDQ